VRSPERHGNQEEHADDSCAWDGHRRDTAILNDHVDEPFSNARPCRNGKDIGGSTQMAKKSKAQLKRLKQRAEARGETYIPPVVQPGTSVADDDEKTTPEDKKLEAAKKLKKALDSAESNTELKSKERRSAKRKAEAIAREETGIEPEDLLKLLAATRTTEPALDKKQQKPVKVKSIPYVLFVGQLSYESTKESLLKHIAAELEGDFKVTEKNIKIRLLTDPQTKQSRGMAFIEADDPDLLYACLKLHHTHLDGRRINVEKSVGGGRANRKVKIQDYRTEQKEYIASTIMNILNEYVKSGEIREGELDEGVIGLCSRHSTAVVEAAFERYVESNGRDMDNPSAYLSFLLGKLATEGIFKEENKPKRRKASRG